MITSDMEQKKAKNELSTAQKMGLGIGLTAAAVTAAGAYFLYGSKEAPKNRKKIKSWMLKAKGEVLEALEKAEKISEAEYRALVETASGAYGTLQKASKGEMNEFKDEMQEHWKKLQKNTAVKKIASVVKKETPKVVTAKKATPKKAAPKKAPKKASK